MNKKILLVLLCSLVFSSYGDCWEGEDEDGATVVIERGNKVIEGQTITIEDDEENKKITVESVQRSGSGASLELRDQSTGETINADMDN